jgi:hypothetical protein
MTMKTYRISFMLGFQQHWEVVQGYSPDDAIRILRGRYPSATSFNWQEVR